MTKIKILQIFIVAVMITSPLHGFSTVSSTLSIAQDTIVNPVQDSPVFYENSTGMMIPDSNSLFVSQDAQMKIGNVYPNSLDEIIIFDLSRIIIQNFSDPMKSYHDRVLFEHFLNYSTIQDQSTTDPIDLRFLDLADIDNDGLQEIFYGYEDNGFAKMLYVDYDVTNSDFAYQTFSMPSNQSYPYFYGLWVGNFDQDSSLEIVNVETSSFLSGNLQFFVSDFSTQTGIIHNTAKHVSTSELKNRPTISSGDLDHDGIDELVIAGSVGSNRVPNVEWYLFNSSQITQVNKTSAVNPLGASYSIWYSVIDDFNNDTYDELVLAAASSTYHWTVIDDSRLHDKWSGYTAENSVNLDQEDVITAVDIDNDGIVEFLASSRNTLFIGQYNSTSASYYTEIKNNGQSPDLIFDSDAYYTRYLGGHILSSSRVDLVIHVYNSRAAAMVASFDAGTMDITKIGDIPLFGSIDDSKIVNVDSDPQNELVLASNRGQIAIVEQTSSGLVVQDIALVSYDDDGKRDSPPTFFAVHDFDNDNINDIVVVSGTMVKIYNYTGNRLQEVYRNDIIDAANYFTSGPPYYGSTRWYLQAPSIGNVITGSEMELILAAQSYGFMGFGIYHVSTAPWNLTKITTVNTTFPEYGYYTESTISTIDFDGDGLEEIVYTQGEKPSSGNIVGSSYIGVWSEANGLFYKYETGRVPTSFVQPPPALLYADLDHDGTTSLYTFENRTLYQFDWVNSNLTLTEKIAIPGTKYAIPSSYITLADYDGDGVKEFLIYDSINLYPHTTNTVYSIAMKEYNITTREVSTIESFLSPYKAVGLTSSTLVNDFDDDGMQEFMIENGRQFQFNHRPHLFLDNLIAPTEVAKGNILDIDFNAYDVEKNPFQVDIQYQYIGNPNYIDIAGNVSSPYMWDTQNLQTSDYRIRLILSDGFYQIEAYSDVVSIVQTTAPTSSSQQSSNTGVQSTSTEITTSQSSTHSNAPTSSNSIGWNPWYILVSILSIGTIPRLRKRNIVEV